LTYHTPILLQRLSRRDFECLLESIRKYLQCRPLSQRWFFCKEIRDVLEEIAESENPIFLKFRQAYYDPNLQSNEASSIPLRSGGNKGESSLSNSLKRSRAATIEQPATKRNALDLPLYDNTAEIGPQVCIFQNGKLRILSEDWDKREHAVLNPLDRRMIWNIPEPFRSGITASKLWQDGKDSTFFSNIEMYIPHVRGDGMLVMRMAWESLFAINKYITEGQY